MTKLVRLIKEAGKHWYTHDGPATGAAISYYAIFSLVPLLGLIIYLASILVNQSEIEYMLFHEIGRVIGTPSALFIQSALDQVRLSDTAGIALFVGIAIFIFGTFGVLGQIQRSLNTWWKLESRQINWRQALWSKVASLSILPVLAVFLILSLLGTTLLSFIPTVIGQNISLMPMIRVLSELIPTLISIYLFAYMYRFLPRRRIPWKEAFIGSFVTAILFFVGRVLVNLYISEVARISIFGTAGTFLAILIWIYISAQMFLFGASFVYTYSNKYGYLRKE